MSRASPTIVGAFVVGGIALAVAAAITLGAQRGSSDVQPFIVQLEGTANGLRIGAPVKFKGVQVGSVERIGIRVLCLGGNDLPIVCFCVIDQERLGAALLGATSKQRPTIPELVERGLRARLETESLVTGIRYISLNFEPDKQGIRHGDVGDLPEIPSLPSSTEVVETGIQEVLAKLQELDLAGLVKETKLAVKSFGDLGASPEVRSAVTNLDQTLTRLRAVAESLDKNLSPLVERLTKTVDATDALANNLNGGIGEAREAVTSLRRALDHVDQSLDPFTHSISAAAGDVSGAAQKFKGTLGALDGSTNPNAPLVVQLQASLAELAGAARAARSLLEQLDRDPSQLLRGHAIPEAASR